jgi:hypothetical protein
MNYLCELHNYSLIEVSQNGVNAFFVRNDLLESSDRRLSVEEAYKEKLYPDGTTAPTSKFWEIVKHMPFVDVTDSNRSYLSKGLQYKS